MLVPSLSIAPEAPVNVVDLGSFEIRAGVAGLDGPTYVRPSFIVGESLPSGGAPEAISSDQAISYLPDERYLFKPMPNRVVSQIIANGCVTREDQFSSLCNLLFNGSSRCKSQAFRELDPGYPMALFQPHFIQPLERDLIASCLFETHNIPALYIGDQEAAAAYSVGKTTALVIDIGYGKTVVSPIVDGHCIHSKSYRSDVTGKLLHEILEHEIFAQLRTQHGLLGTDQDLSAQDAIRPKENVSLLTNVQVKQKYDATTNTYTRTQLPPELCGPSFVAFHKQLLLSEIVQFCFQASHKPMDMQLDYRGMQKELHEKGSVSHYLLPDGNKIDLSFSASLIPEGLFNTSVYPVFFNTRLLDPTSIQMHAHKAIVSLHDSVQPELASNVVVVGGLSNINGVLNRLKLELESVIPSILKVKLVNSQYNNLSRRFAVWYGGNVLSSLGTFPYFWASKAEYEEYGISILDRRRL
ncbi:Actin [Giardia lamblia P15]|uniref:Actin n=1 Tax=Giardia intestinalis (strain P15) TaxID=658858 RepID=E1F4K7_GIAIA|nr:Actin [Giardia lamblia P15]